MWASKGRDGTTGEGTAQIKAWSRRGQATTALCGLSFQSPEVKKYIWSHHCRLPLRAQRETFLSHPSFWEESLLCAGSTTSRSTAVALWVCLAAAQDEKAGEGGDSVPTQPQASPI